MLAGVTLAALMAGGCDGRSGELAPVFDSRAALAAADSDRDGVTDAHEAHFGTDPLRIDSDSDGLTDQWELWGKDGIAIGRTGSLSAPLDPNGNGVHCALDPAEAGDRVLSSKAVSALEDVRVRVSAPGDDPIENDLDGDYIPTDFELAGFYYEIDQSTGEDWFVKWDGDTSRNYYKTDPTKWSTDADPWSDWEEATKRNMDQRVKHPGDHPCIPAFPDLQGVLTSYSIEEAKDITTTNGRKASSGWTNSVSSTSTTESNWALDGSIEGSVTVGTAFGAKVKVEAGYTNGGSTAYESTVKNDTSGMSSQEWSQATAGDTIQTAKLTLNMNIVNVGTMPATEANALFNLRLGDFLIDSFLVNLTSLNGFGELKPRSQNPANVIIRNNGRGTEGLPPVELFLSLPQLQSLQMGAPLTIEPAGFDAQTLVSEWDPDTGRRVNLNIGPWAPYKSAITTATARIVLDLGEDPNGTVQLFAGLPPRRVEEVRVFAYDNTGSYVGSPPAVTLRDALIWGFGAQDTPFGPTVTIRDPVSEQQQTAYLEDYTFGFDRDTFQELLASQDKVDNLLDLALKPSNPVDRFYVLKAPPLVDPTRSIDKSKPRVFWATLDPYIQERVPVMKRLRIVGTDPPDFEDPPIMVFSHYDYRPVFQPVVRAYVDDEFKIREVRFKPTAGSIGAAMTPNYDPDNPLAGAAFEYEVPENYVWTGFETVVAINRAGEQSAPFPIFLQQGSYYDRNRVLQAGPSDPHKLVEGSSTGPATSNIVLIDDNADFLTAGVRAGDVVLNTTTGAQVTIGNVPAKNRLVLQSATWTGGGAQTFAQFDEYAIDPRLETHEVLGYFTGLQGQLAIQTSEFNATQGSYGFSFAAPGSNRNPPFDFTIAETWSPGSTRTISVGNAVSIASLGKASWDKVTYSVLRKASYGAGPLDITTHQDSGYVYGARLADGAVVKFTLDMATHAGLGLPHKRVTALRYEIYRGI